MTDQERHIAVWNNCLQIISNNIDPQQFDTWFKLIRPVSLEGSKLVVEVPTDFFREYIEGAYKDLIKMSLRRALGTDAQLYYLVRPVHDRQGMVLPSESSSTPVNDTVSLNTYQPTGNPSPFVYPGVQRLKINPRLNPVYSFSNLVEGECNRLGVSAGETISHYLRRIRIHQAKAPALAKPILLRPSASTSRNDSRTWWSFMYPDMNSRPST